MRLSLTTALLIVTILGCAIALWINSMREPEETLYLHLFSNRYDIHSSGDLPPAPRDWQCIATISIVSGVPFFADIPCHYEPSMLMTGTIVRHGAHVETNFYIDVADVGPAYRHEQNTRIRLNSLHEFGASEFKFSISNIRDGPELIKN